MYQGAEQSTICSNQDFDFFYAGLAAGKLLIQKCAGCGALRNPPDPMCPHCNSLEWTTIEAKGSGTVYSYTIHHHPPLPHFETPHPVVLVALDEGVRFLAPLRDVPLETIRIGMKVGIHIGDHGQTVYFRPA